MDGWMEKIAYADTETEREKERVCVCARVSACTRRWVCVYISIYTHKTREGTWKLHSIPDINCMVSPHHYGQ